MQSLRLKKGELHVTYKTRTERLRLRFKKYRLPLFAAAQRQRDGHPFLNLSLKLICLLLQRLTLFSILNAASETARSPDPQGGLHSSPGGRLQPERS